MSEENKNQDEITEKIKIMATDDVKIKSFGELLTNDSSRAILQLLFNSVIQGRTIIFVSTPSFRHPTSRYYI